MNLLVVEDDDNKRDRIDEFLRSEHPDFSIAHARSYSSGVQYAIENRPQVILLDMQMPTFDKTEREGGGPLRHFAGIHLLRRLKKHAVSSRVVVVTGFESFGEGEERLSLHGLAEKLEVEFPNLFRGIVYLRASESKWQTELGSLLDKIGNEAC